MPFKIWAEYLSAKVRVLTNAGNGSINPYRVAELFEVSIFSPADIPDLSPATLSALDTMQHEVSWYTVTVRSGNRTAVIVNSTLNEEDEHTVLVTELSHLMMTHIGSSKHLSAEGIWFTARYTEMQRAQATWLANCLKTPRKSILPSASANTLVSAHFEPMNVLRRQVKLKSASVPLSARRVGPISDITQN